MNWLTRTIAEIRDPGLKCDRVGHRMITRIRKGLAKPWKWEEITDDRVFRVTAVRFREAQVVCRRCGEEPGPPVYKKLGSYTSVSLPTDDFDELDETGILYETVYD